MSFLSLFCSLSHSLKREREYYCYGWLLSCFVICYTNNNKNPWSDWHQTILNVTVVGPLWIKHIHKRRAKKKNNITEKRTQCENALRSFMWLNTQPVYVCEWIWFFTVCVHLTISLLCFACFLFCYIPSCKIQ